MILYHCNWDRVYVINWVCTWLRCCVQNWVLKVMSTFQDDSMVNTFGIVILLEHVWVYARKWKGFGKGEINLEGRESIEIYHKCKNSPNISLFIVEVLWVYYLFYFYLFYYFIKKMLYFTLIKWINKTSFYFLKTHIYFIYLKNIILINRTISPYLFN